MWQATMYPKNYDKDAGDKFICQDQLRVQYLARTRLMDIISVHWEQGRLHISRKTQRLIYHPTRSEGRRQGRPWATVLQNHVDFG